MTSDDYLCDPSMEIYQWRSINVTDQDSLCTTAASTQRITSVHHASLYVCKTKHYADKHHWSQAGLVLLTCVWLEPHLQDALLSTLAYYARHIKHSSFIALTAPHILLRQQVLSQQQSLLALH
jgi:hypothetical protein